MKSSKLLEMMNEKGGGFAVGTYNTAPVYKVVGDSLLTEHSVLLGQGCACKVAVFSPKSAAVPVTGSESGLTFGAKVVLVGFSVAVRSGYLQATATSIEAYDAK